MKRFFIASVLTAGVLAGASYAAAAPVEERQALMKDIGMKMRSILRMFNGQVPYDGAVMKDAAEAIAASSGVAMVRQFPRSSSGEGSRASPEIWEAPEEFSVLAERLRQYAEIVAKAARQNPERIAPEMRMRDGMAMGGGSLLRSRGPKPLETGDRVPAEHAVHLMMETCSSCHQKFRIGRE
jgi:cytochrome c556